MTFALTEDQTLLKDTADSFFADKAPVMAFRALRDSAGTSDPALWGEIGAMGFAGALIGEEFDGTAMGFRSLALVLEAQARTLGASALFQTGWVAAPAVGMLGTAEQKAHWLPKIANGQVTFALAWDEGPHHKASGHSARFDNGTVTGTKRFVPDGGMADQLLVAVSTNDGGVGLAMVSGDAVGVSRTPLHGVDSRDLADIEFASAPAQLLGGAAVSQSHLDGLLDIARAGVCAEMLGLASACFTMTHDYLQTRTQFGQLIGSFQALQHRAAAMLVEMELSRSCVVAALDAVDKAAVGQLDSAKLAEAVSLAKARAGDTLHLVTNETLQFHGGIGMTDAHDSGLYIKRARVLEALYGSSAFHRDRWAALNGY
jgi:alkylation response protein AidB-like acyl-CoA dehydrogenase